MSYDDVAPPGSYDAFSSERYPDETFADDGPPRIILMGPRRSGKSSIQNVVFQKMSPHETLFLESTNEVKIKDVNNNALVRFQIVDFPGNYSLDDSDPKARLTPTTLFKRAGALVFVLDGQDEEGISTAVDYFLHLATQAHAVNPALNFEVLIHKVDGDSYLTDDNKIDCKRDIQQQITEELSEAHPGIHPSFYLTSIYDHTIFEAFSKIAQRLIKPLASLENLLDSLIANCNIEKAFLFDVLSKIYVATDSNPVDMQIYELCSDMIDVVIDVSYIYGVKGKEDNLGYDSHSNSVINLSNNYVLYLREVNTYLALVCLMQSDTFKKSGLVEYNIARFRTGISSLFDAHKLNVKPAGSSKKM